MLTKVLILAPNWIGDCLLAQPLFMRLKAKLGNDVRLHALAPPWVAPVLKRMPELDEVISTPFVHGPLQLRARWRFARALKGMGYAQAIVLTNTWKSALIPFFADIPVRIGYVGESRYALLNVLHKLDKHAAPPMLERYAQLAELPGAVPEKPLPAPFLRHRAFADGPQQALAKHQLSGAGEIAALCVGAEYGPAKRWPATHFAELARSLLARGIQVWLLGGPKDSEVAQEVARLAPHANLHNLAGHTTLDEALDLLQIASYAVTNDSGLMHVAAALGKPVIALYGSSSATHTPPHSALAQIIEQTDLPCRPCFARACPLGHFKCMNEIAPARVHLAIMQRSAATSAS